MWGFHYTHFFYAVEPHSPFRVVATSGEFCLAAAQDRSDCESVQFISGLTLATEPQGGQLHMSYGVNDCEAKVAAIKLHRLRRMLKPLDGLSLSSLNSTRMYSAITRDKSTGL